MSTADPDLTPKSTLPITHAVIVMRMNEGEPHRLAAIQFREDGHLDHLGDVKGCTAHFINAMKAAVRVSFLDTFPADLQQAFAEAQAAPTPTPSHP